MRLRKDREKAIDSTGKVKEGKRIKQSVSGVRAQFSHVKERRSPLRLNVFGREWQQRVVPGIQEHENCVQLSPEKGYLIGNESE